MYKVGDAVMCGKHGVCEVEDVGPIPSISDDKNREYYTLRPVYKAGAVVYVPVENNRIVMRDVIGKKEATELLESIPDLELMDIPTGRTREDGYKQVMHNCDSKEMAVLAKSIGRIRRARLDKGKKVTAVDEKYFVMARDMLSGEIAYVTKADIKDIEKQIMDILDESTVK